MSAVSRRAFLVTSGCAAAGRAAFTPDLNRQSIVSRHNPVLRAIDARSPLSVGNGEFAFTADVTGLQTFPNLYEAHVPLCTQSQWGWHSFPIADGLNPAGFRLEMFDTYGRQVGYATQKQGQERLFDWLRQNPHRLDLARIGLLLDGQQPDPKDLSAIEQTLDLWSGTLHSRFRLQDQPVAVITCCHPELDALAAVIESPLAATGRLSIACDFPYGSIEKSAADWNSPERHHTTFIHESDRFIVAERRLDADVYFVRLEWEGDAQARKRESHRIVLEGLRFDFVCHFGRQRMLGPSLSGKAARQSSAAHWKRFWSTGASIDLSGSKNARAKELERRIVLSQYLTAIQCGGSSPPQETGLTCNSWYGKFHLEMHWWHAAHFALWGRTPLLERSLAWYGSILASAREKARQQGYQGVRWPKMTDRSGRSSPSPVGELLIWQQPHPIAMAELCYRSHPNRETLHRYRDVVMQSAEFMASFAVNVKGRYVLGPPVIPAQENHPARTTFNPTFELSYWHQALGIAQTWRERLGLPRQAKWDDVRSKLSQLPVKNGFYSSDENCPEIFTEKNRDHPSMLCAYGLLAGDGVDREIMRRTLHKVLDVWRWPDTWGWDYPMIAMTAARLGEPEVAIDALFLESPKNIWLPNGHVYQRPDLPLYLPANGALLSAVALMVTKQTFPRTGWQIRAEGFQPSL